MKTLRIMGLLFTTSNVQTYKGSIEGGRTLHTDDMGLFSTTDIYTTHGFQFNPYLYVGAGAGIRLGDSYTAIPIYADVNYTMLKKKVSPFIDAKIGYSYNANPCDDWIKPNEMGWVSEQNKTDIYPHGVSVSIGFGF